MSKSNRRSFIGKGAATAAAVAVVPDVASAKTSTKRKVWWKDGKKPQDVQMYSPAVSYGNLLFLSGVGAHFEGDIKAHTKKVLDDLEVKLTECGSSMDKVLKAQVFLADLKDYADMNSVFKGRFGAEPPVRTTVAVAGLPGNSLVEIDLIAFI